MFLNIMRVRLVCEWQPPSSAPQRTKPDSQKSLLHTVLVEGVYGNLNNLNTLLTCI